MTSELHDHEIVIDRVVIMGALADGLSASELHGLIVSAVTAEISGRSLPPGRRVESSILVESPNLRSGQTGIASAVATGIGQAARAGNANG
jgi:hypothetical protein